MYPKLAIKYFAFHFLQVQYQTIYILSRHYSASDPDQFLFKVLKNIQLMMINTWKELQTFSPTFKHLLNNQLISHK